MVTIAQNTITKTGNHIFHSVSLQHFGYEWVKVGTSVLVTLVEDRMSQKHSQDRPTKTIANVLQQKSSIHEKITHDKQEISGKWLALPVKLPLSHLLAVRKPTGVG